MPNAGEPHLEFLRACPFSTGEEALLRSSTTKVGIYLVAFFSELALISSLSLPSSEESESSSDYSALVGVDVTNKDFAFCITKVFIVLSFVVTMGEGD
jgi:hypothetical protein